MQALYPLTSTKIKMNQGYQALVHFFLGTWWSALFEAKQLKDNYAAAGHECNPDHEIVANYKKSSVAVSQVFNPAGTTDDSGDIYSTVSIPDLFKIVNQYDEVIQLTMSDRVSSCGEIFQERMQRCRSDVMASP